MVRRRDAQGTTREIAVDLDAVLRGGAADAPLLPDDQVLVGGRR